MNLSYIVRVEGKDGTAYYGPYNKDQADKFAAKLSTALYDIQFEHAEDRKIRQAYTEVRVFRTELSKDTPKSAAHTAIFGEDEE